MLIWSICVCPSHIVWTTPLSFLKTSLSLQSPISPSTSLASCPSSWWQLRSAFSVKVSTDAHWSLRNLLSSPKSDPKKRDFCEKVWDRMSAAQRPAWETENVSDLPEFDVLLWLISSSSPPEERSSLSTKDMSREERWAWAILWTAEGICVSFQWIRNGWRGEGEEVCAFKYVLKK